MTDSNDNSEGIGRRDAMKAGALAAGGLAIGTVGSQKAAAQTDPERLTLGPEWTLDDKDDGSLVLRNEDSGATFEYDENNKKWALGTLSISKYAAYADIVMRRINGTYYAFDGRTNTVKYSGSDAGQVLQDMVNNFAADDAHIHFHNAHSDGGAFEFQSEVVLDFYSCMITGSGKNKSSLRLADGANTNIFRFSRSSTGAIYELRNLKFNGNYPNNTAGSAVVNEDINELQTANVEIRSFQDYAINFDVSGDMGFNKFVNTWILDNQTGGIKLGNANHAVKELDLIGCTLSGGDYASTETGQPAVFAVDGGAPAGHVNITGGTLRGSDVIRGDNINWLSLCGVQGRDLRGNYVVSFGEGSQGAFQFDMVGCQFDPSGSSTVTNAVRIGSNANNAHIVNNRLVGTGGQAIVDNGGSNIVVRHNPGFTSEKQGNTSIGSSSTSVTVNHGLEFSPSGSDIHITPASALGSASKWWVSSVGSTSFDINVDAQPGQVIYFNWSASLAP